MPWKLNPTRIGLYDSYGGSMPSGWTRWLFEQYEMPFQLVYPSTLDAGDLKNKFDVLVFVSGALSVGRGGGRGGNANVPAEYSAMQGRITQETTIPQLKKFVELGGTIVTIGNSTNARIAGAFGLHCEELPHRGGAGRP